MDKHLAIKLNASRKVTGILRGYDQFMNMVRICTLHELQFNYFVTNLEIVIVAFIILSDLFFPFLKSSCRCSMRL
jgi:hypothetical protein